MNLECFTPEQREELNIVLPHVKYMVLKMLYLDSLEYSGSIFPKGDNTEWVIKIERKPDNKS